MSDTGYWIVASCLALGALAIAVLGGFATGRQTARTGLHAFVCATAAVLYAVLATGATVVHVGPLEIDTHHFNWLLTTPLLLAALMVTASPVGHALVPMALTVIFLDVVMVLARAVAIDQYGGAEWIWFAVSLLAMGLMFALLLQPVRQAARDGHPVRAELYERHAKLVTVLWTLWPVVFLFGPELLGAIGPAWQAGLFGAIDVAVMVAFGLLVVLEDERLIPVEEEEDAMGTAPGEPERPDREQPVLHPIPLAGRALARERLLDIHYRGGEAARLAASRGRRHARTADTPGAQPMASSTAPRGAAARAPAGAPPPPRQRRRKPGLVTSFKTSMKSTPFGRLTREDAVPVAFVAVALLVIANVSKVSGDRDRDS